MAQLLAGVCALTLREFTTTTLSAENNRTNTVLFLLFPLGKEILMCCNKLIVQHTQDISASNYSRKHCQYPRLGIGTLHQAKLPLTMDFFCLSCFSLPHLSKQHLYLLHCSNQKPRSYSYCLPLPHPHSQSVTKSC